MRVGLTSEVMSVLSDTRYATASGIADRLGELLEDVYAALVYLEARGMARVVVDHSGQDRRCMWESA